MKEFSFVDLVMALSPQPSSILERVVSYIDGSLLTEVVKLIPSNLSDLLDISLFKQSVEGKAVGFDQPTGSAGVAAMPVAMFGYSSVRPPIDEQSIYRMVWVSDMGPKPESLGLTIKKNRKPDKQVVAEAESRSENPIVAFFTQNYGKIGLVIAAAAVIWYLWTHRDKYVGVLRQIAAFLKLDILVEMLDSLAKEISAASKKLWDRVTLGKVAKSDNSVVYTGRKVQYLSAKFGVSPSELLELMAFIREEEVEDYVQFEEARQVVDRVKQDQQEFHWPKADFIKIS